MVAFGLADGGLVGHEFMAVDAGCGNGWVVRQLKSVPLCRRAIGVDGAKMMIEKAKKNDPSGEYILANLMEWKPDKKVELVHSMEVFYYLPNPEKLINHIAINWLSEGGRLIFGIDHYEENQASLDWPEKCGIDMITEAESGWKVMLERVGFSEIQSWRAASSEDWAGTLVLTGKWKK